MIPRNQQRKRKRRVRRSSVPGMPYLPVAGKKFYSVRRKRSLKRWRR